MSKDCWNENALGVPIIITKISGLKPKTLHECTARKLMNVHDFIFGRRYFIDDYLTNYIFIIKFLKNAKLIN